MITRRLIAPLVGALAILALAVLGVRVALAHCDGLDGPVVKAAKNALQTGNVNLVLIWVQQNDEPEIRAAFQQTLLVRKQSPEAQALADQFFFETLVRVQAYVGYLHYVERLHEAATTAAEGHYAEAAR